MPFFYVLRGQIDKTISDNVERVAARDGLTSVSITDFNKRIHHLVTPVVLKVAIDARTDADDANAAAAEAKAAAAEAKATAAEAKAAADADASEAKATADEAKAAAVDHDDVMVEFKSDGDGDGDSPAADAASAAAAAEAKAATAEAKAAAAEARAAWVEERAAAATAKANAISAAVRVATEIINQGNKLDCSELIIFEKNDSDLILNACFFNLKSLLEDSNVTIDMYGRVYFTGRLLDIVKSIGTNLQAKAIFISIPRSVQSFYEENGFHPNEERRIIREICPGYERRSKDFFEGEPHEAIPMKYKIHQPSQGGKRKTTSQKSKRKNKQRKITKKRNRISSKKRKYYRP